MKMTDRDPAGWRGGQPKPRLVLGLLFLAETINFFDRQVVNVLAQQIKVDLAISDAELGLLTGTAFGIVYAGAGIPLGRLGDRYDRSKLIAASLALWSVFTMMCGAAANFSTLALSRAGMGIGQTACQPASTSLIADLFSGSRRASALSLFFLGVPIGSFLGLLIGGAVASRFGWRAAFFTAGMPGLILAVVLLILVVDPKQSAQARLQAKAGDEVPLGVVSAVMALLRRPGYLWLQLAMICTAFQVYAGGAWLPPFFIRNHGMSTAEIGFYAALAVGLGGATGAIGGGILCDRFRSRVNEVEIKILLTAMALTVPAIVATVALKNTYLALAGMFAFNVFSFTYLSPSIVLMQRAATDSTRALSVALTSSLAGLASLCVGLPLIGALSDMLAPRFGPMAIGYAMLLCAVAGSLGAFANWRVGAAFDRANA